MSAFYIKSSVAGTITEATGAICDPCMVDVKKLRYKNQKNKVNYLNQMLAHGYGL